MRFNRCRGSIACSFVSGSSGSPENRTQHYAVISRVWATSPRLPFQSGTPESNRDPPAPKAGVLPSAPLPVCLQSERPDLNRRSPVPDQRAYQASPRSVVDRALRSQWAGRCSNPRLRFSARRSPSQLPAQQKNPASSVTPGFAKVPLLRWPSVTSASGARGGYSPVDRRNAPCISARECNSTTRTSFLASPPRGDRIAAGATVRR